MATVLLQGIVSSWEELKANPVFKRSLLPRGFRGIVRSPIVRAVILTAVALVLYENLIRFLLFSIWPVVFFAVLFWFFVKAIQRYFCWLELTSLAASKTLDDYINSGLSRAHVAIGVIYPAVISEVIAVTGVMGYFLLTTSNRTVQVVLIVFIVLQLRFFFRDPFLLMTDVETYLRKRNPVSLFFISIAVVVPLILWFTILFALIILLSVIVALSGLPAGGDAIFVISIIATYLLVKKPSQWWETWRLKRFYSRYWSFEDLFERYVEQAA